MTRSTRRGRLRAGRRRARRAVCAAAGRPKAVAPPPGLKLWCVSPDADGIEREIALIDAPLGLNHRDVRDTAVQLMLPDENGEPSIPILVMHPERCMESRIVNAIELRKTQPLALRQLEVSVICARLWSQVILDSEDLPEEQRVRAVLRINERIFRKCVDDRRFRAVVLDLGVNPFAAVLVDDPRLPHRLRQQRYPQMQEQLADRIERDRRWRESAPGRCR